VIVVRRTHSPVELDGVSDEAAWMGVEPLSVVAQSPVFGAEPSERTDVLMAYDDQYLYVAGRLYDRRASAIHATTMKRDNSEESSDSFGIVLDTFDDNENALVFITTPTGSRLDLTITGDAQSSTDANPSWNTFWDVATARTKEGWFAEIRIPFSSLRFQDDDGRVVMGVIAYRWIARKDERVVFPAIPRSWGPLSHMKPSQAQAVAFTGLRSRRPLYITPYLLGGIGQEHGLDDSGTRYRRHDELVGEVGLDLKYAMTSNLTLDLTANTDFAQVEADDEQVNLTRYPLFFPEKRLFFLERSSNFDFSFYRDNTLFHTRRIGIHNGRRVPIYGGLRVVGRLGLYDLGFLAVQSEEVDDLPSEHFDVIRLRRQVLNPFSYVGGIVASRMATDGAYNTAYGLDGIFRLFGDDYLKVNWAQTFEDHRGNDPLSLDAAKIRAHWERYRYTGWAYGLNYSRSGPEYNPALGFERYRDTVSFIHFLRYGWNASQASRFFQYRVYEDVWLHLRNADNSLESRVTHLGWLISTKSGYSTHIALTHNLEDVREHLSFSNEASVPPGDYAFCDVEGTLATPAGRLWSAEMKYYLGGFYDGRRASLSLESSRSLSSHLDLEGTYQLDRVAFDDRDSRMTAHVGRLRILAMPSARWSLTAFVQYSSAADKAIANLRLRYNPREGTDLYLVYDEGFNTDRHRLDPVLPVSAERTLMVKLYSTLVR